MTQNLEDSRSSPHRQSISVEGITWVDAERPTTAEIDALVRDFGLARSDVDTALSRGESTGIWQRDGYVLVVVQVPVLSTGRQSGRLGASPVALFAARDVLITIHAGDVRPLIRMFRQCETDETSRTAAFAIGIPGLVFAVMQRLVEATAAARTRVERAIGAADELEPQLTSRATLSQTIRLRADARAMWRLASPLPRVLTSLSPLFPITPEGDGAWGRLSMRAERLVQSLEDDLAALDGIFLAVSTGASLQTTGYLRAIVRIAGLTLPVIAVGVVVGMPIANPLASQPEGYTIALAIDGMAFLAALVVLKRGRLL